MTNGDEGPNVRQAVPFFRVADLEDSLRFYVDGLGFRMVHEWSHLGRRRWCWLQMDDAALMLQEFWTDGRHEGRPAGPLGLGVSICFMCRDALALYRAFEARGLAPSRPFVGNKAWVVSLVDPDGYRLDFESATEEAEETEYDPALHG